MKEKCVFCFPEYDENQSIIIENELCLFLQLKHREIKGPQLEGAGVIVLRKHRKTAFDLTEEEWIATYSLLKEVKEYIDGKYRPDGYNLGWNCGDIGGQHIMHAHFHVLPRYKDEPLAGKGIRYMFKSDRNRR